MAKPKRAPRNPRSLPMGMPPRGWLLAGWALIPLRVFLGVAFTYAGLQKLADPSFFDRNAANSIYAQLVASIRTSPIHSLLGQALEHATIVGVLISIGEIAVGLGLLLGLWTRVAAIGGMVIALSLFLSVSFHTSPWYQGPDIVYLFALMPFAIAGAGGVWSLDAWVQRRTARESRVEGPQVVVVPFAEAQQSCGFYSAGRCSAIPNRLCAPSGCPYLEGSRMSVLGGRSPDEVDRRTVVVGGVAVAVVAGAGLVLAGADAGVGRAMNDTGASTTTTPSFDTTTTTGGSGGTTTTVGGQGVALGKASKVPVGGSAKFTVPANGDPGILIQPVEGTFVAYDAICPHAGCEVSYYNSNKVIACPCHGSEFKVSNGDVIVGPATVGLAPVQVTVGPDGVLYAQ